MLQIWFNIVSCIARKYNDETIVFKSLKGRLNFLILDWNLKTLFSQVLSLLYSLSENVPLKFVYWKLSKWQIINSLIKKNWYHYFKDPWPLTKMCNISPQDDLSGHLHIMEVNVSCFCEIKSQFKICFLYILYIIPVFAIVICCTFQNPCMLLK